MGFAERMYLNVLSEVPVIPELKVPHLMGFLVSYTETIAGLGLEKLQQMRFKKELLIKLREFQRKSQVFKDASDSNIIEDFKRYCT